ncbi:hypothetical protein [Thiocapsa roseopersicina]|uniref:Uncharacterized protein n=1 Tax=Thiocapsa roseopersicina TaxID=1058 RepID=A0A1H2SSX3_THIRO|nr:hypothetical protein [Thiocapsa roseopersicina]SDW34678.1 hypothetical protein SAMN05421783_103127 [Thiocapsa roseopersicina]
MDRQIILSVLGVAVLGFLGVLLLMPASIEDGPDRLPWRVTQDASGHSQVFGFTIGETTLAEVRRLFGEDGKVNLFQDPTQAESYGVEAFFDQIHLQRLRADFVIALDVDQATLAAMYERGLRISQVGSGSRKIKLDPADVETLSARPIRSISYLPKARLDNALIEQRFGTPDLRLTEPETEIVHWLYPERGMDIGRSPNGTVVIQYVNPDDFDRLLSPLQDAVPSEETPSES